LVSGFVCSVLGDSLFLGFSEEESSGKLERNGFLYVLFAANLGFALLASIDSLPVVFSQFMS
jgi:hypothetical protein